MYFRYVAEDMAERLGYCQAASRLGKAILWPVNTPDMQLVVRLVMRHASVAMN